MMHRHLTLSAFATSLFAIVLCGNLACGGDKSDTRAESQTEAQQAIRPEDSALAKRIVLRHSDFPTGWRRELSKDEDSSGNLTCRELDFSRLTVTGRAESPDFSKGDTTEASSKVGIFDTAGQAQDVFRRLASDSTARCLAETVQSEITKAVEDEDEDEVKLGKVSVGRVSTPKVGDRSADLQITIPMETKIISVDAYLDLAVVQRDRAVGLFIFVDVLEPFDEDLKRSLIGAASERMPGNERL